MKRLFVHGTIIACNADSSVYYDATLATDGRDIVYVGETALANFTADETIDCTGWILMPGLVNAHVHLGEHLFRGWMDEVSFEGLFYSTLFRWESLLNPEDVLCASRLAGIEAVKAGVTTVADMYHHADATAQAIAAVGLRGVIGQKILGFSLDHPPQATQQGIDYRYDPDSFARQLDAAERFAEEWHGQQDGRLSAAFCPHATNTLTSDMLREVGRRAQARGLPIHMHLAQMASERETVVERDGIGCVELLDRCGILDGPFLGAHGLFVRPEEMHLLERPTAAVVHNPIPNAKDAGLIAPIETYQRTGVRIALGTDAFRMDLLEAARFGACIQRTTVQSGTAFPAREVLQWATLGGAAALGQGQRIGSLEPGKAADIVALDGQSIESLAVGDPHTQVLYYGSPSLVRRVYVDGQLLVSDGTVLSVDESDVRSEFSERMQTLWQAERGRGA
jgi:5-methylthioadenosine/S-adenosylhomocysteine deaminase